MPLRTEPPYWPSIPFLFSAALPGVQGTDLEVSRAVGKCVGGSDAVSISSMADQNCYFMQRRVAGRSRKAWKERLSGSSAKQREEKQVLDTLTYSFSIYRKGFLCLKKD